MLEKLIPSSIASSIRLRWKKNFAALSVLCFIIVNHGHRGCSTCFWRLESWCTNIHGLHPTDIFDIGLSVTFTDSKLYIGNHPRTGLILLIDFLHLYQVSCVFACFTSFYCDFYCPIIDVCWDISLLYFEVVCYLGELLHVETPIV